MKKQVKIIATCMLIFFMFSFNSLRAQVVVYMDDNFNSPSKPVSGEVSWVGDEWNDKISAIKIPAGFKVIAYEDGYFAGQSITLTSDWNCHQNMAWNDRISSIKIITYNPNELATQGRGTSSTASNAGSSSGFTAKVSIKGDLNTYVTMCANCQRTVNNLQYTATLHATNNNEPFAQFTMIQMPNGYYVFKAYDGSYMTLCSGCVVGGTTPDFVTFHETNPDQPWCQFEVTMLPNGKYSIKNRHNGKFMARCNGCSPGASTDNQVALHAGDASQGWAQWELFTFK